MRDPEIAALVAEVTEHSARLWVRAPGHDEVALRLESGRDREQALAVIAAERSDRAEHRFSGLRPETQYRYRIRSAAGRELAGGRFRTAPAPDTRASVRFVWGGDLGGQNVCRDAARGFPIFDAMADRAPHFFIALGDLIYADNHCLGEGRYGNAQVPGPEPAGTRVESFHRHWIYTRADTSFRRFLASIPYYAVWDDHEVVNDFSPNTAGDRFAPGRAAFLDFNPIEGARPGAFYRSVRWGRHLELFILDNRSHRDPNALPDGPGKTMLGDVQKRWLVDGLRRSSATWKIVVSGVPIAIPTGYPPTNGRDGWSDQGAPGGFEAELTGILRALAPEVRNMVWLTTDVHHATGFEYRPFSEYPDYRFHEFVSGPLNAGIFPSRELDHSLRPRRLFYHAPAIDQVLAYPDALRFFNFGWIEIDANGRFDVRLVSALGEELYRLVLDPEPVP